MLAFIFAALIVVLDQFFKNWVSRTIALGEPDGPVIIPGILGLTHWENDGAMLNILSGQQWLLAGIAFVAAVVLIMIILRYNEGFWGTLGLASVLGGTVGNLFDRIFNEGAVVDMFRTLFIEFPIFNIADIFITLGFITFLIHFISLSFRDKERENATSDYYENDFDEEFGDEFGRGYGDDYSNNYSDNYDNSYSEPVEPQIEFPEEDPFVNTNLYHAENQAQPRPAPQYSPTEQYAPTTQPAEPEYYASEFDSVTDTTDTAVDTSFSLYELESEIGSLDDYNVDDINIDDLLREYGLDDD